MNAITFLSHDRRFALEGLKTNLLRLTAHARVFSVTDATNAKGAPAATWRDDGGKQVMERGQSVT